MISLFGFPSSHSPPGRFHWVDGVMHCLAHGSGERIRRLGERFELVWATGWEDKANEYLPFLLELPAKELPVLTFDGRAAWGTAHWKLEAIEEYAGERPAAWVDDNLDHRCELWAEDRSAPTLLVPTLPDQGLCDEHVERLLAWAERLPGGAAWRGGG